MASRARPKIEHPVDAMTRIVDAGDGVIDWLLDSDPSIRWQVASYLQHADAAAVARERARVARCGWGADLLRRQTDDGLWQGSLYNGKWVSTTYMMYLLKLLGLAPLHPQALQGCEQLLRGGLHERREIRFSKGKAIRDLGVSAMVLSLCSYFRHQDDALRRIALFLASQQHADGNWTPDESPAAARYTFETTLLVLEALSQYQQVDPAARSGALANAVARGQEFLLEHQLYLEHGKPIKSQWTSFAFPPYWFYDVMTALDYFCSCGRAQDDRLQAAIALLRRRRQPDNKWQLGPRHPGRTYFDMEPPRAPSRWNTLRALRILQWWNRPDAAPTPRCRD
jgi:hypothetical protein